MISHISLPLQLDLQVLHLLLLGQDYHHLSSHVITLKFHMTRCCMYHIEWAKIVGTPGDDNNYDDDDHDADSHPALHPLPREEDVGRVVEDNL